jgi:hypothetical protein
MGHERRVPKSRNPQRVLGLFPAEGLGVSPKPHPLFPQDWGAKGVEGKVSL